jgi:uncharacterized membrane protein
VRRIYDQIAGGSLERLAALSDGLFSIAMTLLVLDIRVPEVHAIHSERELLAALAALAPRIGMYLMSFLTLGIFWVGQQTQLNHLARADRHTAWIHLAFLASIALMPFSTALLAQFTGYRTALLLYWLNIAAMGMLLYGSWGYVTRAGLVKESTPADVPGAICRRIIIAQSLYALGAALCIVNTYCSIAFIVLVQLNYAVAPRMLRAARSAS